MKKIILLIIAFLSTFVNAQDSIDTTKILNEVQIISVRANRVTPVTQTNLSKSDISKNYIGQDASYILNTTPSINTYSDNGLYNSYTYFRLRGVDQTRINMTLNGIPLNEPEDQGVYFSNYPDFAANLNSIQILRGIGTSSYGSSSYIGSINFESVNLLDTTYSTAEAGIGSYGSYRASISAHTGVMKNKLSAYMRYSSIASNGYRYNSYNNSSTIFISFGYFGNKNTIRTTFFSGISGNGMAYLATNLEDINNDPRTNYLNMGERDLFKQDLISTQFTSKIGKYSNLNTSLFYNHLDGNYDLFSGSMLYFRLKSHFTGLISTYSYNREKFRLNIGINTNYYERSHMATDNLNEYWLYQNKGVKTEFSIFTKIHYNLSSRLIIYGDIQYRNVNFIYHQDTIYSTSLNPIYWNFINPKGGLRFNQSKKISHYTSIGLSHREPTRNDLFNGYDDVTPINKYKYVGFGVDTIDIRTIKPERVLDIELGSELRTNKLNISANIYYMNFKNEIAPIGRLSYIGLPLRKNVKSSFRSGIEVDLMYKPIKILTFKQSFSYSFNRIKQWSTDDSIPQVYNNVSPLLTPSIISNTNISFNWKIITIGLSTRYISSSYLDNTMNSDYKTPDYLLIDGSIGIDYKKISIRTMINNITGVRYFTSGYVGYNGNTNTPAYFIGVPRNIYVTISLKF